jgi:MFS transporter, DHA1 family, inner membrane transport protein
MVMMFVWGFAFYFPAAPIQIRVANAATEAPNLASTLIQSGFNLGSALGPFAGAAFLFVGFGYGLLPWLGAGLSWPASESPSGPWPWTVGWRG